MYAIAFFGALMMAFSLWMIIKPESWAEAIVRFSEKSYFHPFEIVSRIIFGVFFLRFAEQTLYPGLMTIIGYVLIAVAVGLAFTPPSRHRQFAVWSADKFKNTFRPAGFASLAFGGFLIYAALGNI